MSIACFAESFLAPVAPACAPTRPAPPRAESSPAMPPDLLDALAACGRAPMRLAGQDLLPTVQGGMEVGVSAHRLAGAVAAQGGVGTLSSVDLRRHHPDLMSRTSGLSSRVGCDADTRQQIDAANLEALAREVHAARATSGGRGLIAVNVMRAVSDCAAQVKCALEAGIDMVVVGAGLPLDLPDLAADHPRALLVPILSDSRAEDIVEFTGVAGMPARAVATPWLQGYLKVGARLQAVAHARARCTKAFDCLAQCGLRDGLAGWGQFCIGNQLAAALGGDLKKGLYFRGVGSLPFERQIRSVRELMEERLLMRGFKVPQPLPG